MSYMALLLLFANSLCMFSLFRVSVVLSQPTMTHSQAHSQRSFICPYLLVMLKGVFVASMLLLIGKRTDVALVGMLFESSSLEIMSECFPFAFLSIVFLFFLLFFKRGPPPLHVLD
eukprot:m.123262 g.123262  ORF g.123262 m.123262 type:complete len:116 (-) comp15566_c0_seq1:156-503(-)